MTITVTRDTWGIGHAVAPTALDAFWVQGWLAASDRIWQMEWDRRRVAGRWAEVVGPVGVREDRFFRRLGLNDVAKADWAALMPETKAMTEAYAAGVNAWLDDPETELPAEFTSHPDQPEPWEPWHCVAVYKVRHLFMGTFHRKLWRGATVLAAGPEAAAAMRADPSTATAILPGEGSLPPVDLLQDASAVLLRAADDLAAVADTDGGSNSWAIHGSRTQSGRPLLAGDPHRGIEFPNVYHQCHLSCPDFDAIGLAFPGVPGFPHFGHNRSVAWCITHGMADDTDVFVETADSLSEVTWRTETITVKGSDDVAVRCGVTPRGPVVLGEPEEGAVLSMMWTGLSWDEALERDTTLDALWPMLNADGCQAVEETVRPWVIPVNSLLTADVAGDISFKIRGRVVERPVANRWTPVPGTDEHSWQGVSPANFDDLPHEKNPQRGFLVTANNRVADAGPYISLDFAGPARHDRIVDLLADMDDATAADMPAIHGDVHSKVGSVFADFLASATPTSDLGKAAKDAIKEWNRDVAGDSTGATAVNAFRRHWTELIIDRLGVRNATLGGPGWPDRVSASRMAAEGATALLLHDGWRTVPGLDSHADLHQLLGQALDSAATELAETLGPDLEAWRWDAVHVMVSPHPLATALPERSELHPPVDGCPGDGDTVRAGAVAPIHGDRSSHASVGRYVFDLADWDNSGWVVPHGVSGVRGSGHDLDQRSAWLACELLPMAYSAEAVAEHGRATFELSP